MSKWITGYGWLEYNPARPGIKKMRAANDFILMLNVPGDICKYYGWWLQQKGITVQHPVWRPHVTVLNGRQPVKREFIHNWKKYQGEKVFFKYAPEIELHWKFWTLPVHSPRLQEIRLELGFDISKLHLTIGREFDVEPNLEIVNVL